MKQIFLLILFSTLSLAQHFNLDIAETGESTLFIFETLIDNLEVGDEVGVYDADGTDGVDGKGGGGGGGSGYPGFNKGGAGGDGIVIIRYETS